VIRSATTQRRNRAPRVRYARPGITDLSQVITVSTIRVRSTVLLHSRDRCRRTEVGTKPRTIIERGCDELLMGETTTPRSAWARTSSSCRLAPRTVNVFYRATLGAPEALLPQRGCARDCAGGIGALPRPANRSAYRSRGDACRLQARLARLDHACAPINRICAPSSWQRSSHIRPQPALAARHST